MMPPETYNMSFADSEPTLKRKTRVQLTFYWFVLPELRSQAHREMLSKANGEASCPAE